MRSASAAAAEPTWKSLWDTQRMLLLALVAIACETHTYFATVTAAIMLCQASSRWQHDWWQGKRLGNSGLDSVLLAMVAIACQTHTYFATVQQA